MQNVCIDAKFLVGYQSTSDRRETKPDTQVCVFEPVYSLKLQFWCRVTPKCESLCKDSVLSAVGHIRAIRHSTLDPFSSTSPM